MPFLRRNLLPAAPNALSQHTTLWSTEKKTTTQQRKLIKSTHSKDIIWKYLCNTCHVTHQINTKYVILRRSLDALPDAS